ncbi:hypothetical protein AAGX56_12405, partial [Staphylococcus aureus]
RGPNIENFEKKFYRQCKLAGPQHREFQKRNSTGNAGWRGPNIENFKKEILQAVQVGGPQHREFQKRNSTGSAGWGTTIKKYFFFITLCPTHFPKY